MTGSPTPVTPAPSGSVHHSPSTSAASMPANPSASAPSVDPRTLASSTAEVQGIAAARRLANVAQVLSGGDAPVPVDWPDALDPAPVPPASDVVVDTDVAGEPAYVPMLDRPRHLPFASARPTFSPAQYFAASRVDRDNPERYDTGLYLTETPCTVQREGVTLLGQTYFAPEIIHLLQPLPGAAKREYVARYNRAEYARGVLRWIIVGEWTEQQTFRELARCEVGRRHRAGVDLNRVIAERYKQIELLQAKQHVAVDARLALQVGTERLEEYRNEQRRRERAWDRGQPDPIVATPRVFGGGQPMEDAAAADDARKSAERLRLASGGGTAGTSSAGDKANEFRKAEDRTDRRAQGATNQRGRRNEGTGQQPAASRKPRNAKATRDTKGGNDSGADHPPGAMSAAPVGASDSSATSHTVSSTDRDAPPPLGLAQFLRAAKQARVSADE